MLAMEDLRREFAGEPANTSPIHETGPPKRPEKLPPDERAETPTWDEEDMSYVRVLSNEEVHSSGTTLPSPDSADEAISDHKPRSAQFWAVPARQLLHPMWQLLSPNHWALGVHRVTHQAYQGTMTQRSLQSRDAVDFSRSQRGRDRDDEQRHDLELEHLRRQLREANTRADQAERVAEEMTKQLETRLGEMAAEMAAHNDSSVDPVSVLKTEIKGLKVQLDEARSHIFSLQPYRKDVTPKEVGQVSKLIRPVTRWLVPEVADDSTQEFDDLVNGITDWVTNFMDPILDDDDKMDTVLTAARKRPADLQKLKKYLHTQGDLIHGTMFPETDIDILIAVTMRFLQDHIFQKILFGAAPGIVEVLSSLEASMQNNVEPRRGTVPRQPCARQPY